MRPENTATGRFIVRAIENGARWHRECAEHDTDAFLVAQTDAAKTWVCQHEKGNILVAPFTLITARVRELVRLAEESDDVEPIPDTYVGGKAWRVTL